MRRITLWSLSTITLLVLLFSYRTSTSSMAGASVAGRTAGGAAANGPTTSSGSGTAQGGQDGTSPSSGTTTKGPSATTPTAAPRTYTGRAVDTAYGPVQVRITVAGGKVTKAVVTQVPWNDSRDQEINGYAVPILNQEVVQAQGAGIDMVSGATFTSEGYAKSLQSAIDQAHL